MSLAAGCVLGFFSSSGKSFWGEREYAYIATYFIPQFWEEQRFFLITQICLGIMQLRILRIGIALLKNSKCASYLEWQRKYSARMKPKRSRKASRQACIATHLGKILY